MAANLKDYVRESLRAYLTVTKAALATKANASHTHSEYQAASTAITTANIASQTVANAAKWTTARTLTLGGNATGTATLDGSANITLPVTILSDSHTHAFANLTGRPTTLAGYGITDAALGSHNHSGVYEPANSAIAKTNIATTWTKRVSGSVISLPYAATITWDSAGGNYFKVALTGNATLANPTNALAGTAGLIEVSQDATGNRTLSFGTLFQNAPSLDAGASRKTLLHYYISDGGNIYLAATRKD